MVIRDLIVRAAGPRGSAKPSGVRQRGLYDATILLLYSHDTSSSTANCKPIET
jgi:hypothetical protein